MLAQASVSNNSTTWGFQIISPFQGLFSLLIYSDRASPFPSYTAPSGFSLIQVKEIQSLL